MPDSKRLTNTSLEWTLVVLSFRRYPLPVTGSPAPRRCLERLLLLFTWNLATRRVPEQLLQESLEAPEESEDEFEDEGQADMDNNDNDDGNKDDTNDSPEAAPRLELVGYNKHQSIYTEFLKLQAAHSPGLGKSIYANESRSRYTIEDYLVLFSA
ncbi:hypothetical protein PT974_01246 [Cladobotryum mycophilum]|uniref:Uncharacterized protein n=1 Tax=Cladobotryum mycophilum TaxID=491253 RepID=A0ABR0T365_9HYPO